MHEYEYVRRSIDDLASEMKAIRESNADLHAVLARVDERLELVHDALDQRLDHHSRRHEETAARVLIVQQQLAFVRAWAAGAGVACTVAISVLAWALNNIPPQAWRLLVGGTGNG